jgi:hypothetical protein
MVRVVRNRELPLSRRRLPAGIAAESGAGTVASARADADRERQLMVDDID